MSTVRVVALLLVVAGAIGSAPAHAQQSRAALIAAAQAEKATRLRPYQPTRTEALIERAQRAFREAPRGLYPWFGSILDGGLLAAGPGFRMPFGGSGAIDAQGAYSLRSYKLAAMTVTLPEMADRRLRASLQAKLIDAPEVAFYGLGNQTRPEDETSYLYRPTTAGATMTFLPAPRLEVGAGVSYLGVRTGGRVGDADTRLPPGDTPGLGTDPKYVLSGAHVAVDWRDSGPGYNRSGGYYRVDWSSYARQRGQVSSFRRLDVDLRQLIPIQRANWIVALRATGSVTDTDANGEVPFFLMPQLGGGSDLRGYPSWRFRDRHRVLFSAEYRWTPAQIVDMAVFHDAGKVTSSRDAINFRDLKHSTGVGIRFHTPNATLVRLDVARGTEGIAVIMAFGPIF